MTLSSVKVLIDIDKQSLSLVKDGAILRDFKVSTSKYGIGSQKDSFQTPVGRHVIRAKIGAGEPLGRRFISRRPTEQIIGINTNGPDDYILSRILWLSGCEVGLNRLGNVDTMQRYIYIHGTHREDALGTACSLGCIRMANDDVIWLFDQVEPGTSVEIRESFAS